MYAIKGGLVSGTLGVGKARSGPGADGNRVRVLLDALAQLRVLEAVECDDLVLHAVELEDLAHRAREAALGQVGRALHEQYERVLGHNLRRSE